MTLSPSHDSRARNLDREQERQDREVEVLRDDLLWMYLGLRKASAALTVYGERCRTLANDAPDHARVKALRAEIEEYLHGIEI